LTIGVTPIKPNPTAREKFGSDDSTAWPANILDWNISSVDLSFLNATVARFWGNESDGLFAVRNVQRQGQNTGAPAIRTRFQFAPRNINDAQFLQNSRPKLLQNYDEADGLPGSVFTD